MAHRRLRNSGLVWQLINVPSRLRFLMSARSPAPAEAAAIAALRERGIAVVPISELFPPQVFDELKRCAEERWRVLGPEENFEQRRKRAGGVMTKNLFLVDLWGPSTSSGPAAPHVLDLEHPFIRFSLSEPVLTIVNGYLGMLAKFREFFLQATIPTPPDLSPYASQRWHADPDDRRMVKVFLYLSDVDGSAGPFTYIERSHSRGKWRKLFPHAPKVKSRHPDPAFIARTIPPEDIFLATGRAGTIIFCDTSGVHRGGYATTCHRIMYTSVYTTRASARATRLVYPPGFRFNRIAHPAVRYAVRPTSL